MSPGEPQPADRPDPPSPCVGVCRLHPRSGLCMGCLRTLEEIADWSEYGRAEKLRVLALLPGRRREAEVGEAGAGGGTGTDGTTERDASAMTATSPADSKSADARRRPVLLSWSGGKDSAMALHALSASTEHVVAALLSTVTGGYERISMHGVRAGLLHKQVEALGLPVHEVRIPPGADNAAYEAAMERVLAACRRDGIDSVAFGDLFLEDIRAYRESKLAAARMGALFPIWGRDTAVLAREFVELGYRARVVCVDPRALDASFAGRQFDADFLSDLPATVDPCGENGEFHTFVHDGPLFRRPVPVRAGDVVERGGFVFCDLLPGAPGE